MRKSSDFDVIVVGAGHAGIEAAMASARLGVRTGVVTTNIDRIGFMSCNPSIGGLGKGHMVREVDVLGGVMGLVADLSCIQFKRLNARKGAAVRGSRAQCDKEIYNQEMVRRLSDSPNMSIISGEVKELIVEHDSCVGVRLGDGSDIFCSAVVITTGTFLNGVMHIGMSQMLGGRVGDLASVGLSAQLKAFGFEVKRLKTGTPPRLYRDSIDFSKTSVQKGDDTFFPFSYRGARTLRLPQVDCYLSYTNEETHDIIRRNLDKSPMFCGAIEGSGPRYCPSIEDKITRFADKAFHQTFLEPESLSTDSIYLQGISTSLPEEVQYEFLKTIPGLENVRLIRPGYAVEYDFVEPTQISHSLETKALRGLFLAGQINGTSGYEEAAAQGLMAGVNAASFFLDREPLILRRDQAYIGVLIDDLVTKGTREPYRMFTSRAEHRLVLREDNTLERLAEIAHSTGLLNEYDFEAAMRIISARSELLFRLKNTSLSPTSDVQAKLTKMGTPVLNKQIKIADLLRRNEVNCLDLKVFEIDPGDDPFVYDPVEIEIKYEGYIVRQNEIVQQAVRLEELRIPSDMNFGSVKGLSAEEIEKLNSIRPRTLGQASRISGVNPSAIQSILIRLKGRNKFRELIVE